MATWHVSQLSKIPAGEGGGDDEDDKGEGHEGQEDWNKPEGFGQNKDDLGAEGPEKKPGEGEAEEDKEDDWNPDEAWKETEQKLGKRKSGKLEMPPLDDTSTNYGSNVKSNSFNPLDIGWVYTPPKFNWRALLAKLVHDVAKIPEETYIKPSSSAVSQASVLAQHGAAVIKPGEIKGEARLKLCLCVDSSGSMGDVIGNIYNEIRNLLKTYKKLDSILGFVRFTDGHQIFEIKIGSGAGGGSYKKVTMLGAAGGPKAKAGNVEQLFTEHDAGGTELNDSLTADLTKIMDMGYYCVLFTDNDSTGGHNLKCLFRLLGNSKFFAIFKSQNSYVNAIQAVGGEYRGKLTYIISSGKWD